MINSNFLVSDIYSEINKFIDESISKLNEIKFNALNSDLYNSLNCEINVKNLKNELILYFKNQQKNMKQNRRSSEIKIIEEIIFTVICFFDETFICLNWNGRQFWRLDSIEKALYTSQAGGDVIFSKIEKIVLEKNPNDVELAKIYFTLLKLGFKGKYRELNFSNKYEELTENLREIFSHSISFEKEFEKPSYLISRNKYENFIKKESIYLTTKYIAITFISAFIIGEIYWIILLKFN